MCTWTSSCLVWCVFLAAFACHRVHGCNSLVQPIRATMSCLRREWSPSPDPEESSTPRFRTCWPVGSVFGS